jgi:16S rRNA (cytosine1402-N4)-methyltransferase
MHESVMTEEVLQALALKPGSVLIDATINGGGHSEAMLRALSGDLKILGIDRDASALRRARERLAQYIGAVKFCESNFKDMERCATETGVVSPDAILFDLGLSSDQLTTSGRGFSFKEDEPLLMTFAEHPGETDFTAAHILNEWGEATIADILFGYGEERQARRIAKAIVARRKKKPFETTHDVVSVIEEVVHRRGRIHPATKTFQALRIAVNDELTSIREGLTVALRLIAPQGRIAVISFHSLEDRVVKTTFREAQQKGLGATLKKPVFPSSKEVSKNPRARSAKLRLFTAR